MAWVEIAEADVLVRMNAQEVEALKTTMLAEDQEDPMAGVIAQVVDEVRGHVEGAGYWEMGDAGTVPARLVGAVVNRVRFLLAGRLPDAGLMNEDRRKANEEAMTLFGLVRERKYALGETVVSGRNGAYGSETRVT
jgi:hypothetical protein